MAGYEIAIAGAGIGGLATALLLARAGHRVVLAERFATPHPLGSGLILQPTGLGVLDALGIGRQVRAHGRRIRRLYGESAGRTVLDVRYAARGEDAEACAVHRSALFGLLFEAVKSETGVALESGFDIERLERGADGRPSLVARNGRTIGAFDMIVDAAGSRSSLSAGFPDRRRTLAYGALWGNAPWPGAPFDEAALAQRYAGAHTMAGVLPIGRRFDDGAPLAAWFWSLKPRDYPAWRARGLDAWKADVVRLWPDAAAVVEAISGPDDMILATYGHHTLRRPFGERLAVIGDAAHATSPQLGQGANMALLDATALADALKRTNDPSAAPEAYAKARRTHVRLYQAMSRLFTPVYQSDSHALPWLRDRLFAPASRLPGAAGMLARMVAGDIGRSRSS